MTEINVVIILEPISQYHKRSRLFLVNNTIGMPTIPQLETLSVTFVGQRQEALCQTKR